MKNFQWKSIQSAKATKAITRVLGKAHMNAIRHALFLLASVLTLSSTSAWAIPVSAETQNTASAMLWFLLSAIGLFTGCMIISRQLPASDPGEHLRANQRDTHLNDDSSDQN